MATRRMVKAATRPRVTLIGQDGNAFMVMGLCRRAAIAAGWDPARVTAVLGEMASGNYSHLLVTAMKYFDVR